MTFPSSRRCSASIGLVLSLVVLSLTVESCGYSCGAAGCYDGLLINLEGERDPNTTFDIDFAVITPRPEVVRLLSCTLSSSNGAERLLCGSSLQHTEPNPRMIQIISTEFKKIQITISSGGTKLSEQVFEPAYASREINGPGCGTCTNASVRVPLPQASP